MFTRRIIIPLIGAVLLAPKYVIGGVQAPNTAGGDAGGNYRITSSGATRITSSGAIRATAH